MRTSLTFGLILAMSISCTTPKDPLTPQENATPNADAKSNNKITPTLKPPSAECGAHPFTPKAKGDFKHKRSTLVAISGAPAHAASDGLFIQGAPIELRAKFAYGDISKDLEDEPVELFVEGCDGWASMGESLSDDDGVVKTTLPALPNGVYSLRYQVKGDASIAEATLRVLPKGTHLVVFDIDGTMTTSDEEIMKDFEAELLGPLSKGDYVPAAYPSGPELTQIHAKRGAQLLYMTGRPYWLMGLTKEWLTKVGFSPATVKLTNSTQEALPITIGVGTYKLNTLKDLIAQGFVVDLAYGNASTDIYAYTSAGIDPKSIYIIGPHGGDKGTNAVKDSWAQEAERAKTLPNIEQPK